MDHKSILQELRSGKVRPQKYGDYWSEDERALLCRLFDEGNDISEIAIILQRSEASVVQQLNFLKKFKCSAPSRAKRNSCPGCKCKKCTLSGDDLPTYCPRRNILREDNTNAGRV